MAGNNNPRQWNELVGGVRKETKRSNSLRATHRWRRTFDEGIGGTDRMYGQSMGGRGMVVQGDARVWRNEAAAMAVVG